MNRRGTQKKGTTRLRAMRRVLLVTDAAGRIVATALQGERSNKGPSTTLRALPDQTLHEVPLPLELEGYVTKSAAEWHRVLSEYELRAGPAQSLLLRRTVTAKRQQPSKRH
jgi:hypothetical protein